VAAMAYPYLARAARVFLRIPFSIPLFIIMIASACCVMAIKD
jgi:hypothetical protein